MKAQLVKRQDRFDLYNESDGSKIASTLPNPMGKLSLKNCKAIENGYELDELADEYSDGWDAFTDDRFDAYKEGFKKALSILGDKKFSEEDMKKSYNEGCLDGAKYEAECGDHSNLQKIDNAVANAEKSMQEFIQSIQKTEWDCIVEMEENCPYDYTSRCTQGRCDCKKPKLDSNGCLILKRK